MSVVLADRNSKKIFFSMKPKESEELIQKKKSLMVLFSCLYVPTFTDIFMSPSIKIKLSAKV